MTAAGVPITAAVAEVAVTLPVPGRYHYLVPSSMAGRARVGSRVLVRFGNKKVTGVVVPAVTKPPVGVKLVELSEVLDDEPALSLQLVDLCLWIADYYEAPPGEVMRAALPAGSGVASHRWVALTDAGRAAATGEGAALPPKQQALLAQLAAGEALAATGQSEPVRRNLEALRERGLVEYVEKRDARVRLKRERIAVLVEGADVDGVRAMLGRAPKKVAALEALVGAGGTMTVSALNKIAASIVPQLVKLGLATVADREVALDAAPVGEMMGGGAIPELTGEQAHAVAEITAAMSASAARSNAAAGTSSTTIDGVAANRMPASPPMVASAATSQPSAATSHAPAWEATSLATAASMAPRDASASDATNQASAASATTDQPSAATSQPTATSSLTSTSDTSSEPTAAPAAVNVAAPSPSTFTPFLLHGVTGSGKTEVYLRVIARALEQGKTALVLVPEISLTPQLAARFRARFGDLVAILHSGLTEQARLGEWSRLHRGEATIAVGARSAVFAPLANIGVIVVDEEHDGSFKQDEGVRYHGRDVALVRAQRAGAVCVLGSATPSLESYAHAERGAYRLLVLTERPTARPMPSVEIVDLRTHMPDGDAFLAAPLRAAIGETLANGDQTILFLNRRGFSTFVLCRACGHAFRCPHCSVSLTYHRHSDRLNCHYCGFWQRVPEACPGCGAKDTIVRKGLGTEKVADAVAAEFPQARVARLDRDVASGAKIEGVLSRVARREVDVLVGTQMVTKGHDFPGVTLVGVLCADTGLNVPDFRASERTFQLLAQVAGRAGRGDRPGRVIVQTYRPGSHAVTCAAAHDYKAFFEQESSQRGDPDLMYPPHGRLIAVRIDGANASDVASNSHRLAQVAEGMVRRTENSGVVVRGAVPAPMERIRNRTRWQIWLRGADRAALRRVARAVLATEVPRTVRVALDVDPISAL